MISDIDIYRVAELLIERQRQNAPMQAAIRADRLRENGDRDELPVTKWAR